MGKGKASHHHPTPGPSVLKKLQEQYLLTTSTRLKIIDSYILFAFLSGVLLFVYCCLVGTFPFNSFLASFISCVTSFVSGVALRLHFNSENSLTFLRTTPWKAFGEFIFLHVFLHLAVINFIG